MPQNYAVMAMAENKGINMVSKTKKIEAGFIQFDSKVEALRNELLNITDEDLVLFSEWLYNSELSTLREFIEAKAYDQSCEPETF